MSKVLTLLSSCFPKKNLFFLGSCLMFFGVNMGWGQEYCVPNINSVEPITRVILEDIDNQSSASTSSPAYEDFTNISTDLEFGESYSIALEGNTDGSYTSYFTVFIDFNDNGILDDAGEIFQIGSILDSTGEDDQELMGIITIPMPSGTITPGPKRMRVLKNYNSSPLESCENYLYGQTEDYTVILLEPCTDPISITASNTEICFEGEEVTLTATGGEPGIIYFQGTDFEGEETTEGNQASISAPGTYYFRAYNETENCWGEAVGIEIISQYSPENINAFVSPIELCIGDTFQLFGEADLPQMSNIIYEADDYVKFQHWTTHYKYHSHNEWDLNYTDFPILNSEPVMRYDYISFTGHTDVENYVQSPMINGSAYSNIELSLRHYLSEFYIINYAYDIKIEVSLDTSEWEEVYSGGNPPQSDIGPEELTIILPETYNYQTFYLRFLIWGDETGMLSWEVDDIKFTGTADSDLIYSWTGPNGFESNEQNPIINNPGEESSGTYVLTVQYGVCSISESVEVVLENCQEEAFINPHLRNQGL